MNQILLHSLTLEELLSAIEVLLDKKLQPAKPAKSKPVYLSRKEVASLLMITLPTLHDWTKLGWLKSYKIGTRVLYKESDVIEAIEGKKR